MQQPIESRTNMRRTTPTLWSCLLWSCLSIAVFTTPLGCSSDDDDGNPDASMPDPDASVPDPDAGMPDAMPIEPTVTAQCIPDQLCIVFPPPVSRTDRDTLTVRGTTHMPTSAVRVNGVAATTTDDYATWQAAVPLTPGTNMLDIERDDDTGTTVPEIVRGMVISQPLIELTPTMLAIDAGGDVFVAFDRDARTLVTIGLTTGLENIVTDALTSAIDSLAVDAAGGRALITYSGETDILSVDLNTGAISVLSGMGAGTGPALVNPAGIAVDVTANRALVMDVGQLALVAVDLATGDRTTISDAATGMGPALQQPRSFDFDAQHDRVLVNDRGLDALVWIDLGTGDRTVAADLNPADNLLGVANTFLAGSIAYLPDEDRVLVSGGFTIEVWWESFVLSYDLAGGTRSLVSNDGYPGEVAGTGMTLQRSGGMVFDAARSRVLVTDTWNGAVTAIDTGTGHRTVPWGDAGGPNLVEPREVRWDANEMRALVSDRAWNSVIGMRGADGVQAVLGDPDGTSRAQFTSIMAWDSAQRRAYVVDALDSEDDSAGDLSVFDLATGTSSLVQAHSSLDTVVDMTMHTVADQILTLHVSDDECTDISIHIKDVVSLDEPMLSGTYDCGSDEIGSYAGSGVILERTQGIALDVAGNRVLATDTRLGLVAVDIATGARAVISDDAIGAGMMFSAPNAIAMDVSRSRAIVMDDGHDALLAVDLPTGDRSIVSPASERIGNANDYHTSIAINEKDLITYAVNVRLRRLVAIDMTTGERVIWWGTSESPAP